MLAAGLTITAASAASAATTTGVLPTPSLPAPTLPALPLPAPVQTLVATVTAPLTGTQPSVPTAPSAPTAPALPGATSLPGLPGLSGLPGLPGTSGASSSGTSSGPAASSSELGPQVKGALNQAHAGAAGTPLARIVPDGSPADALALRLNLSPLATACLQATGSGTGVANTTLVIGGQNISAPIVSAMPGVLAPCPTGPASTTPGVDLAVGGLVGLCVKATPQPPIKATILALDQNVLTSLTQAGVPLQQVVVPCPTGTPGTNGGGTHHPGGAAPGTPATNTPGSSHGSNGNGTTGSRSATAATGSANGSGSGSAADCTTGAERSSLASAKTAGVLPSSGASWLPWLLLGLVLVGRKRVTALVSRLRTTRG